MLGKIIITVAKDNNTGTNKKYWGGSASHRSDVAQRLDLLPVSPRALMHRKPASLIVTG